MPGFSLVELLTVVAILSVLASVLTPAMTSILGGKASSQAMEVIANTMAVARQTAMTTGQPVALVVSQPTGATTDESQGVLLLGSTSSTDWVPTGAWTKLPANVRLDIFNRDGTKSFYGSGAGGLPTSLPVKLNGKDVTAFDGIVFYPNGAVDSPANGPAVTLSRLHVAATVTNPDYTVVVQSDSGRAKIIAN